MNEWIFIKLIQKTSRFRTTKYQLIEYRINEVKYKEEPKESNVSALKAKWNEVYQIKMNGHN